MDSLLPLNRSQLEIAIEQALTSEQISTHDHIQTMQSISSPFLAPTEFLPWLAWSVSVDEWQDSFIESAKRQTIKDSYLVHAHKGTISSIKRILIASGFSDAKVIENKAQQAVWTEAGGRYLNGDIALDGASFSTSSPPKSMTTHWAEYLVEFNLASAPTYAQDQAALRSKIEKIAPVRCRLSALLYKFEQAFIAPILMTRPISTVLINFNECQSFSLHKANRIDGCKQLFGELTSIYLSSGFALDGKTNLKGSFASGDPLNQGWGECALYVEQNIHLQSNATKTDQWLLGDSYHQDLLDGSFKLGSSPLDGKTTLSATLNLSWANLSRPFYALLNGARTLGMRNTQARTCFSLNAILHTPTTYTEIAL